MYVKYYQSRWEEKLQSYKIQKVEFLNCKLKITFKNLKIQK